MAGITGYRAATGKARIKKQGFTQFDFSHRLWIIRWNRGLIG
jgi:hypothetical protein